MRYTLKVALSELSEARRPVRPVLETVEFLELRDSMDSLGQLVPIITDSEREIVDGHRRFRAAKYLNWNDICITVRELSEKEKLAVQITLNKLTLDEYRRAIIRFSEDFDVDKLDDVAYTLCRDKNWLISILGLKELIGPAKIALNNGLDVHSAVLLAKLKPKEQRKAFCDTLGLAPSDRVDRLREEVRHFYERKLDRRAAKRLSPDTPILRSERAIVKELFEPTESGRILVANDATTAKEGWDLALRWALQIDEESVEQRRKPDS